MLVSKPVFWGNRGQDEAKIRRGNIINVFDYSFKVAVVICTINLNGQVQYFMIISIV